MPDIARATTDDGRPLGGDDCAVGPTRVAKRASIGSNATILCGVTIGAGTIVGSRAVVTKDVAAGAVVAGVPARTRRNLAACADMRADPNLDKSFDPCFVANPRAVKVDEVENPHVSAKFDVPGI